MRWQPRRGRLEAIIGRLTAQAPDAETTPVEDRIVEQPLDDVSTAVVAMLGRDRQGGARVLDRVVGQVAGQLLASGPSATLQVADELTRRGDDAGARLLLHAVARVAPDRVLDEAAERLRPSGATRRRIGVFAAVLLAAVLLAVGVMGAVVSGNDPLARALLVGSVGPVLAARYVWVSHVPVRGLTLQESQLWRSLTVLRPGDVSDLAVLGDGRLRRAMTDITSPRAQRRPTDDDTPDVSGWVGLGGVIGAVLGLVGGLAAPGVPDGTFLALMPIGAVAGALVVRARLRAVRNRPEHSPPQREDRRA